MYPLASSYRRLLHPVVRGWTGVVASVAVFLAGSAIGGRAGVAVAAAWVLASGAYCLANFWCCRETHCVLTGPGWTALGFLGLAASLIPGDELGWLRVEVLVLAYLAILGAGHGFEALVAARTGRHALGVRRDGAEAR